MNNLNKHNEGYYAHSSALIDEGAKVGKDTKIWHWVHICSSAQIGSECSLGQNVYVGNKVEIGDRVKIQNNVSVYDNVFIEDDVFCGPSMVFTNVYNPRSAVNRKNEYKDTFIRQGASLGANCTIICGVEIGKSAFVAAGSVVKQDVKAYELVAGVPAKHIGWMSEYGKRLHFDLDGIAICAETNSTYYLKNGLVKLEKK